MKFTNFVTTLAISLSALAVGIAGTSVFFLKDVNQSIDYAKVQISQPIPISTKDTKPEIKASPSFESLSPCEQLDAIAKSGKSVRDYLDQSSESQFNVYKDAVKTSCNWHQEQVDSAIALWQSRQPKTVVEPVTVIQDIQVIERIQPKTGSGAIAESGQDITRWQEEQARKRASENLSAGERCAWGGSASDCNEFKRQQKSNQDRPNAETWPSHRKTR